MIKAIIYIQLIRSLDPYPQENDDDEFIMSPMAISRITQYQICVQQIVLSRHSKPQHDISLIDDLLAHSVLTSLKVQTWWRLFQIDDNDEIPQ